MEKMTERGGRERRRENCRPEEHGEGAEDARNRTLDEEFRSMTALRESPGFGDGE